MSGSADSMLGELDALRALARALVHGDAAADDLLQDTAVAALEHPPALDRSPRSWLATVVRNRWRMDRRAARRRATREQIVARAAAEATAPSADELLERARALERLATALVALGEPFRATVILRYLDGHSAATIARALGVPTGTVRWRLKTGLDRLRATLDDADPRARWQRALVPAGLPLVTWPAAPPIAGHALGATLGPLATGALVKAKTTAFVALVVVLLLAGGALVWYGRQHAAAPAAPATGSDTALAPATTRADGGRAHAGSAEATTAAVGHAPTSQGRATVAAVALAGGAVSGRVINWSSGDGVADAELTFTSDAGASTIRTAADGAFRLVPPAPGSFALATVSANGFLPYAPELAHSSVRIEAVANREVGGVIVFLFPALDYHGQVVDAAGAPVAGAHVHLLGTPAGEQAIDRLAIDWVADRDGKFTFHAADEAVLEAVGPHGRGWARLDGNVTITKQLVIKLGDIAARDATITGQVVDATNQPLADVLVRGVPSGPADPNAPRASAFAMTATDGTFALTALGTGSYDLSADADPRAPIVRRTVDAGATGVTLTMATGVTMAGQVVTTDGEAVPAYTLLVLRRDGVVDELVLSRSVIDARGAFSVHVAPGDYQLIASATGLAPSARTPATAAAGTPTPITIKVSAGATLHGTVVSALDNSPIPYARVTREGTSGGASAQPANAGTVTRADGSFELTGIPAGPLTLMIAADSFHPRLLGGLDASDGGELAPAQISLDVLAPGELPTLDLVGIGVKLTAASAAVRVDMVVPGGGAAAAGIVVGDLIVSVDGAAVTDLGMDGTVGRIRGAVGTTVVIGVQRGDQIVTRVVERRKLKA